MAKRQTDTDKWKKNWFNNLSIKGKLLWLYINDNCNHAGVCEFSPKLFSYMVGFNVTSESLNEEIGSKIQWIDKEKIFVLGFIEEQYGELNPSNRVHKSVLDILNKIKEAPYKPLISPLEGDKDKDIDIDISSVLKDEEVKEKKEKPEEPVCTWKNTFTIYQAEEKEAFNRLINDGEWMEQQERLKKFPNLNIKKTLEKARIFWTSEDGWKHKKSDGKRAPEKINWKSTYANALTVGSNHVFDPKEFNQPSRSVSELYGN